MNYCVRIVGKQKILIPYLVNADEDEMCGKPAVFKFTGAIVSEFWLCADCYDEWVRNGYVHS